MTPDSRVLDAPGRGGWRFRQGAAVRLAAHLAVWAPFIYALTIALLHNWVPVGDDAVAAVRSWDVLSAHAPLVGAPTRLAHGSHGVYDLGPLEYWLLAVPVHLNPAQGVWWGAALWCMLAGSLAIEAASSAGGALGTVVASGTILGIVAWIPQIATWYGPAWNPWFGLMFFIAALAACWAVISGRRQWWPVLTVAGSVAAQAHDMFVIAAVALVCAGFIAVVTDSVRSGKYRPAIIGVIAGLACWVAPLIQQFTSRPGNLTVLSESLGRSGRSAGFYFGLKALSAATQPPACWWRPIVRLGAIDNRGALFGAMQLVVVALALVVAIFVLRSRRAAALAALSLIVSVAAQVTYSSVPARFVAVSPLQYMMAPLFLVGVLAWLAVGAVVVLAGRQAISWVRGRRATPRELAGGAAPARLPVARWGLRIAGLAAAALIASASYGTSAAVSRTPARPQGLVMSAVSAGTRHIERVISARRVALEVVGGNVTFRRRVTLGLAYALRTAGYVPELPTPSFAMRLGPFYGYSGQRSTQVTVLVHGRYGRKARVVARIGPAAAAAVATRGGGG